jgi:hypothetical protein
LSTPRGPSFDSLKTIPVNAGTRIAYLHGFSSSPASIKGQRLARAVEALPAEARPEYFTPQLSPRPREAIATVYAWVERATNVNAAPTFIGSSLGGFYATHLAERYGTRAVLINPAIHPEVDLAPYVGVQRNLHTGKPFEFRNEDLADLATLGIERLTHPERYFLLVQTGDEVLDYRAAVRFYAGAFQFVQGGGDHGFEDFAAQIPAVLRFAGVATHFLDAAMPGNIADS